MANGPEVEGAATLARTLHGAASELDELETAAGQTGQLIRSRAAGRAPKRTGRLARSITATVSGSDVEVGSGLIYAPVQHNGWAAHGISPHPFLIPVAEESAPIFAGFYARDIESKIRKVRGA